MKKKLSLDLGELRVDTFGTTRAGGARGTVNGYYGTFSCDPTCGVNPNTFNDPNCAARGVVKTQNDYTGCLPCCV